MKPIVLLDVHMEDLEDILSQKNWNIKTISKEIGSSSNDEIIQYTKKTKCIVVSDNEELVKGILSSGGFVVSIDSADRARIIHEKIERIDIPIDEPISKKNSLEFCKQHFYLL